MGIKTALVPKDQQTAGVSMPEAANGGYGMFYQDRFYEADTGNTLPCLYEDSVNIMAHALTLTTLVELFYAPQALIPTKLASQLDRNYAAAQAAERGNASLLSPRKLSREFESRFNGSLNYHMVNLPEGGARVSLKITSLLNPSDNWTFGTLLGRARVYSYNEGDFPVLMEHLQRIGYDADRSENEIVIGGLTLDELKTALPPVDPDIGPVGLQRLKNWGFKLRLVNPMAGMPIETMDYDSYKRVTYNRLSEIENPKILQKAMFESVFNKTQVECYFTFDLDAEEVQYATQSEPSRPGRLLDLSDFVEQAMIDGVIGGYTFASFVTPIQVFEAQQIERSGGFVPTNPPRLGVMGLMIAPSTLGLVRIPDIDAVTEYRQDAEALHISDGRYDRRPIKAVGKDGKVELATLSERVVKVDWVANLMTLSTGGRLDYIDISEWGPATAWHIRRLCEDPTLSKKPDNSPANGTFTRAVQLAVKLGLVSDTTFAESQALSYLDGYNRNIYAKDLAAKGLYPTVGRIIEQYLLVKERLPFREEFHEREYVAEPIMKRLFNFRGVTADNPIPIFALIGEIVGMAYDAAQSMTDAEVAEKLSLSIRTILNWRANMEVWNTYCRGGAQSYTQLQAEDKAARSAYGRQPEDQDELPPDFKPRAIPNIRVGDLNDPESRGLMYMPHQAKARFSLERNPQFAILAVDAGGGKTISIVTDILSRLDQGQVQRPAVYCPAHLLSNYVEDANYATSGTVNIVPVNTTTVDSFGREYFEKLVKAGPKNTIFVVDYDFCKWNPQWISYGPIMEEWYGNAQWLRSLGFDGVWFDEAHYLKNDSQRAASVRQSIVEVQLRILATGTMLATRLEDVVNQMALLDPGVFGTQDRFNDYYGSDGAFNAQVYDFELGTTVSLKLWMARTMEANCCVVKGRRKEWAALLPPKQVRFHWVDLSEAQRKVYNAILETTLEEIKNDPKVMALLAQQDEDMADQLEAMLQTYLQRIERFLTAPGADELSVTLSAADLTSPKGRLIGKIAQQHYSTKTPGKILVFTSYIESARAVYEALPPEIREHALLYTAARKMECREQFEKDPNIWMMIGVEQSMNTGINAQFASRLIRVESVYSPGILEQGESRINRPNIKSSEFRTGLFLDWVLVDKSIDVTKSGRLMWRSVDAAKFYNPDSARYQELPDLHPLRLTIDSIIANNSFDEVLPEYLDAYLTLENNVKAGEIAEYKARHPTLDFVAQDTNGMLEGSGLLKQIPYVPGGGVFNSADLGLVPVNEFERMYGKEETKNQFVHTDMGDGTIYRVNKDTIGVRIGEEKYTLRKASCFVITKRVTSTSEIRRSLAKNVNLKLVDVDTIKQAPGIKQAPVLPESLPAEGKLLLQVRDVNDGEWGDVVRLKDGRDDMAESEVEEFYLDYMAARVNRYAQANSLDLADLEARLIDSQGNVVFNMAASGPAEPEPADEGDTHGDESPVPDAVEDGAINLLPCFYNEFFALIVNKEDQDLDTLGVNLKNYGFQPARESGYVMLERWQHARDLEVGLRASKFDVPEEFYEQLKYVQEALRTSRTHFQQYRHLSQSLSDLRLYQLEKKRRLKPNQVRPFFTVCDGTVFVMVDVAITPAWPMIRSQIKVRGARWEIDSESFIFLTDTKQKLVTAVKQLAKDYPIAEMDWVKETIGDMSNAARKSDLK